MKNNLREQKAITLVALIITIIVLLILAMVSIRLVINGGIIDRANRGTQAYSEAEVQEQIKLAYAEWQTAQFTGETRTAEQFITARLQSTFGQTNGESNVKNVSVTNGKVIAEIRTTGEFVKYSYDVGTGVASVVEEWKQKEDETITDGNKELQIGDLVNYQTELAKESNAVDTTKKAELISDLSAYSGNTHSEYNTDSSVVRNNLTWSVLDVKDGKLRLISTVPTVSAIKLENADGYNNAVYLLDKACDTLYSIDGVGKAQNLKIEDIEDKLVINDGKTIVDNYIDSNVTPNIKYGDKKEYTSNLKYPNIYQSEIGCKAISSANNTSNTLGVSEQRIPITGNSTAKNRLKVTQTAWYKEMESTDFTNSKYFSLFINNGSDLPMYWLASRSVDCYDEHVIFGVRIILGGKVRNLKIFFSNGGHNYVSMGLRPVITLSPDVKIGEKVNGVWQINS